MPENDQGFFLLEHLFLLKETLERATVAVLIDKVEIVGGFECLDEPDNILISEGGEDIDFVDGQLFQFRIALEGALGDNLNSILLLGFLMNGTIDLPVDSFADRLLQQVVLD